MIYGTKQYRKLLPERDTLDIYGLVDDALQFKLFSHSIGTILEIEYFDPQQKLKTNSGTLLLIDSIILNRSKLNLFNLLRIIS